MRTSADNNKRIAKNTLLLYIRMFISIIVGLYTSRVVLEILGISDYGVFNVVGGIVAMLGFLNSAMTGASQRYISFELGKQNNERLNQVFCTSVLIHFSLAVIVVLLAETFGLWFLNNYLNIDPERIIAANYTFQCSVLSFVLTIVSVPYNACIVAHERMNVFAYVSILEVSLRLLIVLILPLLPTDKLIAYSVLTLSVAIIMRLIYGFYCKRNFTECSFSFIYNKNLYREMFSFAGWNVLGNLGFSVKDQGANIILNLFYGTTVNAARGIAMHVNSIISNFSQNFLMAINPQITKFYASNDIQRSGKLVYLGCRFGFFFLLLIVIPVIQNKDYILGLWLKEVPEYTAFFLQFTLLAACIEVMSYPLTTALQATGRIKDVQISVCLIMLFELIGAYIVLLCGGKPYMTMYPTLVAALLKLLVRFFFLKRIVTFYQFKYFVNAILLKNLFIAISCFFLSAYIQYCFNINSFIYRLIAVLLSLIVNVSVVFIFGLTVLERKKIISHLESKLVRK